MPTINDIYSLTANGITSNLIVQQLINEDGMSRNKQEMISGANYYAGKNDVLQIDFRQYKANGQTKTNENRSNQRISHNFTKLLVNQAVSYICGNPITYKYGDDDKFQEYLDNLFMFDFDDNNVQWLKESRTKGKGYVHVYYEVTGQLNYTVIPSEQIIPIYKDMFKKELQELLRYYSFNAIDSKGKPITRHKVEWWTDKTVNYFVEDEEGNYIATGIVPHWSITMSTSPDIVEEHGWGRVPFVQLFNNDDATSDLQDIKASNDAYDIIQSEFVNQIADVREILIKVMGYSGTSADDILQCFRGTGIVKIDDPTGNIDVLKAEIPVEARSAALKNLKENIFMLGMGVDTTTEKLGTAVSGIALKFLYGNLDMKCNTSIRKMRKAVYEFAWFITDNYNRNNNTSINYRDITFSFNKNMIMNDAEIIESLAKSKGLISDETIIERHPYVSDPTEEEERMQEQEEKQLEQFNVAMKDKQDTTML